MTELDASQLPERGARLLVKGQMVTVIDAVADGDRVDLVIRGADGKPDDLTLSAAELADSLVVANDGRGSPVGGLAGLWSRWMQYAVPRIRSAVLATRPLRPYAHQDEAVFAHMLAQPRLRFLLADEPGTGKTVMTGMYLAEASRRGLIQGSTVIVVPKHLVAKWQRDLLRHFAIDARQLTAEIARDPADLDPRYNVWVVSVDLFTRNSDVRRRVAGPDASWSLAVFDEAHRLTPTSQYLGAAQELSARAHHLLLLTATPHRGKEHFFRALLNLLDSDLYRLFAVEGVGVKEPTLDGRDPTPASRIAWNFFTAMYCKAGGYPWSPHGLTPGTCYVGIGFYHPLGTAATTMQTSLVQAFDERGEGLVLRGHDFEWDPRRTGSRSPHLTADGAHQLMQLILDRYEREMKQTPARVVVHKTSRYCPDEREGFQAAIEARVQRYDLMALESQSRVRLITTSKYPPLRGTRFNIGELDYLYTTGFISALNEFHGMHVPSPLQVADHIGQDSSREKLLREVLTLTKLNWNSAALGELLPITINFSRLVGEIMREIPRNREPLPQFKFYI